MKEVDTQKVSADKKQSHLRWLGAGLLFAVLWSSAATATKIGLTVAQPMVIAVVRFGLAAIVLLAIAHGLLRHRLPRGREWKQLAIYGLLNIAVYLGLYVVAMQSVTASIGSLAVASNPVFISFLSVFFLRKPLTLPVIISILICVCGVVCAAWPLLGTAAVNAKGLLLLAASMISYSAGAIYFSANDWNGLSLLVINGWQTALGGLFLWPFAVLLFQPEANQFNHTYWLSVAWLALPVSIGAVQVWLWLLRQDAVRAGLWLFLCPLFGLLIAAWLVNDKLSLYTLVGLLLVLSGLLLSKQKTETK